MNQDQQDSKVVIFDFDGTIANTMIIGLNISNRLAKKYGYRHIEESELRSFRNKKSQEVLKSVNLGYLKLPLVANSFRKELNKEIEKLQPIPGIKKVIIELFNMGHTLAVVTSNSKKNLSRFLEIHELQEYFSIKHAGVGLFGKSKVLKGIMKRHQLNKKKTLLVGDETRDIDAAHRTGLPIVSVTWGFNSKMVLKASKPEYLISSPEKLVKIVNSKLKTKKC